MKTPEEKFDTVIAKNTYYFVNQKFEDKYEIYLTSLRDKLLLLKNQIDRDGCVKPEHFERLILEDNGLAALLALTGFSEENFKRILTVIRILQNSELERELGIQYWNNYELLCKILKIFKELNFFKENSIKQQVFSTIRVFDEYHYFDLEEISKNIRIKKDEQDNFKATFSEISQLFFHHKRPLKEISVEEHSQYILQIIKFATTHLETAIEEWTEEQISFLIRHNQQFSKGLVNLFFRGSSLNTLVLHLPAFELKKLSISKLKFELPELLDSLVRYKQKGSYSGQKENNPEILIEATLKTLGITYEKGDLKELLKNEPIKKRTMDFIIPNKSEPLVIIECSFLATTSSGQGDKSKTENAMYELIKKYYPEASFIGFVDGIGWYVRKGDLKRMVTAYEDVFTYHKDELQRFEQFILEKLNHA